MSNPLGITSDDFELRFGDEPIRAWRCWKLSGGDLLSGNGSAWPYRQRMEAACTISGEGGEHAEDELAPARACTCGIYAARTHAGLVAAGYDPKGWEAWGTVKLWGQVQPHERGYRAQYAYPELVIVNSGLEAKLVERNYGCEVWLREDAMPKPGVADPPPSIPPAVIEAAISHGLMCNLAISIEGQHFTYSGPLDPVAVGRWYAGLIATVANTQVACGQLGMQLWTQVQTHFWKP